MNFRIKMTTMEIRRHEMLAAIDQCEELLGPSQFRVFIRMDCSAIQEQSDILEIAHMNYRCEYEKYVLSADLKSMPSIQQYFDYIIKKYGAVKVRFRHRLLELDDRLELPVVDHQEQPIEIELVEPVAEPMIINDIIGQPIEMGLMEPVNENIEQPAEMEPVAGPIAVNEIVVRNQNRITCNYCDGEHKMHKCPAFLRLWMDERVDRVREMRLCANCFMVNRQGRHLCAFGKCRRCEGNVYHNSLLCPKFLQYI